GYRQAQGLGQRRIEARSDFFAAGAPVEARDPGSDAAQDLPGDGPGPRGHLVGPQRLLARTADDDRLLAQGDVGDLPQVDGREIHADASDDRRLAAAHQDVPLVAHGARYAVVVAQGQGADARRARGDEGPAIPERGPGRHAL